MEFVRDSNFYIIDQGRDPNLMVGSPNEQAIDGIDVEKLIPAPSIARNNHCAHPKKSSLISNGGIHRPVMIRLPTIFLGGSPVARQTRRQCVPRYGTAWYFGAGDPALDPGRRRPKNPVNPIVGRNTAISKAKCS
jgi:hypothetical protein